MAIARTLMAQDAVLSRRGLLTRPLLLLTVVLLCWTLSPVGAAERSWSRVDVEVENQTECGAICRGADPAVTYCYYWRETKLCRLTDNRLPNPDMRGPYQIYEVRTDRWLTRADLAAILAANPPPPLPNLAGRWTYKDGSGRVTITQTGDEVIMELTWSSYTVPGPHYTVKAWVTQERLSGWWFCNHRASCPSDWLPFEATLDVGGLTIATTANTEDPSGEGWGGLVLHRDR